MKTRGQAWVFSLTLEETHPRPVNLILPALLTLTQNPGGNTQQLQQQPEGRCDEKQSYLTDKKGKEPTKLDNHSLKPGKGEWVQLSCVGKWNS